MGIEGKGGGNANIQVDFKTRAKINPASKTTLQSADEIMTVEIPKGTSAFKDRNSVSQISMEVIQPSDAASKQGVSDIYKFEPMKFIGKPAELRIKSNKVGQSCPTKLVFYQFNEKYEKKSTESTSVTPEGDYCLAVFEIDEFI